MAHGDYTGMRKQALAHQFAEEQALAAKSKSLVSAVVTEASNEVIDLFCDKDYENLHPTPQVGEDGEVTEVDVVSDDFKPVQFRASEDLDEVTVGQGRQFSLKGGRTYKAPRWVAEYLDEKGLVWH